MALLLPLPASIPRFLRGCELGLWVRVSRYGKKDQRTRDVLGMQRASQADRSLAVLGLASRSAVSLRGRDEKKAVLVVGPLLCLPPRSSAYLCLSDSFTWNMGKILSLLS